MQKEHISAIELLVKQLKDVNEAISNSAVCSKVINSLPTRFNAFRTAWDSVAIENQTFENLTARLLKEETRTGNDESETTRLALEVKALQSKLEAASFGKKTKNISEIKKNTSCHYCKHKGHWARECRKRLAEMKEQEKKPSENPAYICDISALYTMSSNIEKTEWICDSGASVHMTGQNEWFTALEPTDKPMHLKIADDTILRAAGKGTIEIQTLLDGEWHDRTMYNALYVPGLRRKFIFSGSYDRQKFYVSLD